MKTLLATFFMSLALAVSAHAQYTSADQKCLALNIYHEARGSTVTDRAAVSDVVLNRVKDPRFPNTVCGVIHQGKRDADGNMIRYRCQFSWYCDGRSDVPQDPASWLAADALASSILFQKEFVGLTSGSTHYHADYIDPPSWARSMTLVVKIGGHYFYRWE